MNNKNSGKILLEICFNLEDTEKELRQKIENKLIVWLRKKQKVIYE